jgi:Transcriptional regulator
MIRTENLMSAEPDTAPDMPAPPTRRPRRDSIRKHKAIIAAARRLFLEKGYGASSMDEVAEIANVSKRTVYVHFGSKEKLFFEMIAEMCSDVIPQRLHGVEIDSSASAEALLVEIGTVFLANIYTADQIRLLRQVIAESGTTPEMGQMMFEGPVEGSHRAIRDYLAAMARQGLIDIADADLAAKQFQGLLKTDLQLRLLLGRQGDTSPERLREIVHSCVDLFLHGCARR